MKYFTIEELSNSAVATKEQIANTPSLEHIANLTNLINTVLDPAREKLGRPIAINSGYRSAMLNKRVGGARNSYHLQGRAADLNAGTKKLNLQLHQILANLPHKELINEQNGTWIHVAL